MPHNDDKQVSVEALNERVYQGLQKKRKCELCLQQFFVEELPGAITYKSILELRARWGSSILRGARMPSPSQLYKRCELCIFCMQFFDVDDAPPAAMGATVGFNSTKGRSTGGSQLGSPPLSPGAGPISPGQTVKSTVRH